MLLIIFLGGLLMLCLIIFPFLPKPKPTKVSSTYNTVPEPGSDHPLNCRCPQYHR